MKSTTWSLVWLVVTGCSGAATLDKNGTSGSQNDPKFTKMPEKQEPAEAGSFLTEREGFSRLASRHTHVSAILHNPTDANLLEIRGKTTLPSY